FELHISMYYNFLSINLPLPYSPLFPYTTLFRSISAADHGWDSVNRVLANSLLDVSARDISANLTRRPLTHDKRMSFLIFHHSPRSEEHTSELQSQSNLVCRLLLEKKNNKVISEY